MLTAASTKWWMRFQISSDVSEEVSKRPCSLSLFSTIMSRPASDMARVDSSRTAAAACLAAVAASTAAAFSCRFRSSSSAARTFSRSTGRLLLALAATFFSAAVASVPLAATPSTFACAISRLACAAARFRWPTSTAVACFFLPEVPPDGCSADSAPATVASAASSAAAAAAASSSIAQTLFTDFVQPAREVARRGSNRHFS